MRKLLFIPILIGMASCCTSCCTKKPVIPGPSHETIVHYIDSTIWHDSTVITYLPKEKEVDVVKPMDTLKLETSYAKAEAYMDTAMRALRGSIENKPDAPIKIEYKWKDRIVYKDSIHTEYEPYPVEVTKEIIKYPKTYWFFLTFTVLILAFIGFKLYLKFKKV